MKIFAKKCFLITLPLGDFAHAKVGNYFSKTERNFYSLALISTFLSIAATCGYNLQLGKYETIDQINAAKYFGSLSYVDESRIGIFGWSYGGFMSSLCLFKGNDVFKAAIAVAPVTNWKWYDSVYTERYMRTDKENEEGYYDNSPVHFADRLEGNYLLVHGMADENVHFQNTAEMVNALVRHNKQFDTYFYPNRNHGIFGGNTRLHLFTKMTNFVLEKL